MKGKHSYRRNLTNTALGLPPGTPRKAWPKSKPEPTPQAPSGTETHSIWTVTKLSTLVVSALYGAGLETIGDVRDWMRDPNRKRIMGIGPATYARIVQQVNLALAGRRGMLVATKAA